MTQTRMTRQRFLILETLRSVDTHPTADELYAMVRKDMPRISLGTVYRNLDVLEDQGEILCLEQAGTQKRFDGNTAPHQHVRCTRCGRVGDIHPPVDLPPCRRVKVPGFTIENISLHFSGICDTCRDSCS